MFWTSRSALRARQLARAVGGRHERCLVTVDAFHTARHVVRYRVRGALVEVFIAGRRSEVFAKGFRIRLGAEFSVNRTTDWLQEPVGGVRQIECALYCRSPADVDEIRRFCGDPANAGDIGGLDLRGADRLIASPAQIVLRNAHWSEVQIVGRLARLLSLVEHNRVDA